MVGLLKAAQEPGAYCHDAPTDDAAPKYRDCLNIANAMVRGVFKPTTVATHFHDVTIHTPGAWRKHMRYCGQHGKLLFWWEPAKVGRMTA